MPSSPRSSSEPSAILTSNTSVKDGSMPATGFTGFDPSGRLSSARENDTAVTSSTPEMASMSVASFGLAPANDAWLTGRMM